MYGSPAEFAPRTSGPRVAVFVTAAYGVSELPTEGEFDFPKSEFNPPLQGVQASEEAFEEPPPEGPVQSSRATGPGDRLIGTWSPNPCGDVSGLCDQVTVQQAIFTFVDPFTSNGTVEVNLPESGEVQAPLAFQAVATNGAISRLAWIRNQEQEPPPQPYLFQADASPVRALVCGVGPDPRIALCEVASASIANATVRVSAPNPRRIIDPVATGPLLASLDVPADVLLQLQVPTLTVTVESAQLGQANFTQGDVVTITARFDYGPRGPKLADITFTSSVVDALTGDSCLIGNRDGPLL